MELRKPSDTDALSVREVSPIATLGVESVMRRQVEIDQIISTLMQKGVHYGPAFPGSDRDSLLQPGAEMLAQAFGFVPQPETKVEDLGGGHRLYLTEGGLFTAGGILLGLESAECSTIEPKYRYRNRKHVCPKCQHEAIIKSRQGPGWYCFPRKGGCGEKFEDGDVSIEGQELGKVEHEDPGEYYHTCRMMSQKRWFVAIIRRVLALSSRFVDGEAYAMQPFDWNKPENGSIQRLMQAAGVNWAKLNETCLREFGKTTGNISNAEAAVIRLLLQRDVRMPNIGPEDLEVVEEGGKDEPEAESLS